MRISRSKIELYIECPRCFYFDVVMKKGRPSTFPLNLNIAVDTLLKREFDVYREMEVMHPIQREFQCDFIPAKHPMLENWRNIKNGGLSFENKSHNCTYFGTIDDLWINSKGQYAIVDYKSTAKEKAVMEVPEFADGYIRQLSFYNYLLKKNQINVIDNGFLVYATGVSNQLRFDNQMKFILTLIRVDLTESWIESTLDSIYDLLKDSCIPNPSDSCRYCRFVDSRIVV
jgi:hypothetical protein